MGMKAVKFTNSIAVTSHPTLPSPSNQATMLDTTVMHAAYGMAWLEQAPPAFTTSDYAVMPFSSQDTSTHYRPGENLTATTDVLTTEVNCWQPMITKLLPASTYTFDNGHGCAVNVSFFQGHPYNNDTSIILYIGYYGNAILDYCLESPRCSKNSSNQFLTIFASKHMDEKLGSYETNMTALFCETSYYKQPASVTVSAESGRPLNKSIVPAGVKEPLSQDEFNSTAFTYLVGVGMPPDTPTATRDFPAATTFEPWGSLSKENIAGPTMPMVNLALGLSGELASDFQHADVMERAFTLAHKTVFSAAISHLASESRETEPTTGTSSYNLYGVVVSRTISAVLECLLVLLAFLMAGVLYTCMKAQSNLVSDPATIGFAFRSVRASRAVLNRLAMEDCSDNATLQKSLAGEQFFLEQGSTGNTLEIESKADGTVNMAGQRKKIQYDPVRPKELHPLTGCFLIALLLAGAGVLIYFKKMEQKLQGKSAVCTCYRDVLTESRTTTTQRELRSSTTTGKLHSDGPHYPPGPLSRSFDTDILHAATIPHPAQRKVQPATHSRDQVHVTATPAGLMAGRTVSTFLTEHTLLDGSPCQRTHCCTRWYIQ